MEMENYTVVNFTNIDSEDYVGMWAGKEEVIKSGETKPYPKFLADHLALHLAKKILLRNGDDFGDEGLLKSLKDKILGNVEVEMPAVAFEAKQEEPEFEALKEKEAVAPKVMSDFKCEVCGKVFSRKIGLTGHLRTHKKK